MRRTGRYYYLTLACCTLSLITNIGLSTWGKHTAQFHLWVDVVGQGAGYAGVLTTTLIVSALLSDEVRRVRLTRVNRR
jgi:hypothetical protein